MNADTTTEARTNDDSAQLIDGLSVFTCESYERMVHNRPRRQRDEISGFIRSRSLNLLAGDSGLGKTPLALQLALCKASGKPFLDNASEPAGPVLYCDFESDGDDFWDMVRTLSRFLGEDGPPAAFHAWSPYWDERWQNRTNGPSGVQSRIAERVHSVSPKLVIIDALRLAFPEVSEKGSEVVEIVRWMRGLATAVGSSFLLIHQPTWPQTSLWRNRSGNPAKTPFHCSESWSTPLSSS